MAEVAPPSPEVQTPAPTTTSEPTEKSSTAQLIDQSQKGKDEARETLTKVAKLKQVGSYGLMGFMAITMLTQLLKPMMAESEGQPSGH